MYLDFYNLREYPFNITPDPRFLYYTTHHREAFDHVLYGITQRKGFIQLTGEVGSGKTTLCRAVLDSLDENVVTALILNPCVNLTQFLRAVLYDFGQPEPGRDRLDCMAALNGFLLEMFHRNRIVAVLIDEAQNLSGEMMEQIRLLSNLETDQYKLVQILLCGQPELKRRLAGTSLRQLRQRISVRYHIPPLSAEEMDRYITHRLQVAGADGTLGFTPGALRIIRRFSRGCPRLINTICDHALLAGYVLRTRRIDRRCAQKALKQVEGCS